MQDSCRAYTLVASKPRCQDVVLPPARPRVLSIITKHPERGPRTTGRGHMVQGEDKKAAIVASAGKARTHTTFYIVASAVNPLMPMQRGSCSCSQSSQLFAHLGRWLGPMANARLGSNDSLCAPSLPSLVVLSARISTPYWQHQTWHGPKQSPNRAASDAESSWLCHACSSVTKFTWARQGYPPRARNS